MSRISLYMLACLSLGGCVTNNLNTQNAQVVPTGTVPARPQAPAPAPTMTLAAKLANAKMITVNMTTTAGASLTLASPQSLNRDCSPLGDIDAKIVTPPDHGTVSITRGLAFPNFAPADPPYLCNARKSPATLITYHAAPGFVGEDTTSVQIFFPDGRAPMMLFHLHVQ